MNNDQNLIAEAYSRMYLKMDEEFRDQMPSSKEVYEPEAERKEAQAEVNDTSWAKKYVPYGPYQTKKYQVGVDGDKGEFVLWSKPDEGEMTYYYYLVYKNEGKLHDIDEEQYNHLSELALSQR